MKKNYNINEYFKFLGYYPSDYTPICKNMRTLTVYVRGDRKQLDQLLEPTPFVLNDDRFVVSIADFRNQSHFSFFDAAVLLPVRFGEVEGSTYYFEYEDDHQTVASGREKWGYPKQFAHISLDDDAGGARGSVTLGGETIFRVAVDFDEQTDKGAWQGYKTYPHLQARAISEIYGPSFSQFDIISRDTSKDYELLETRIGRASVEFSGAIGIGGQNLTIVEVLGGEYAVGNFASTRENGRARVIDSLV
ncbi:acetoacetate decarboxylase family protein [Aquibaculum sediminis]|uniref:acetoacetate decarboxylase family protein n=1 Tax=Aquibaculum sediminis TaxID=3231907 RepID=UPI0034527C99